MSDRDENLKEYLVLLRRFGLSKRELADRHWSEPSDPPDVSPDRLVAYVIDDESRTVDALYSRMHSLLAASSLGMEISPGGDATELASELSTVFAPYDVSIEVEPVGASDLEDVGEGDPIDVRLTDRHGNRRSTTDTYPAPDELPEIVGVIERELLSDVAVTFRLLDPDETRWRFVLLSEQRLGALADGYGEEVAFQEKPLLADRQPTDFVSSLRTQSPEGEPSVSAGTPSDSVPNQEEGDADGAPPSAVGGPFQEGEDTETAWFDDDDVNLEDVGFEPATAGASESEPVDDAADVDTEGIDRAFAEIESEAADIDWNAPAGESGSTDDLESVDDILESAETDEREPASEPDVSVRPEPDPTPAIRPIETRPDPDPAPAVRRIRTVPADDPTPATVEALPEIGLADAPTPATVEAVPEIEPAREPGPATHGLQVSPGTDPSLAVRKRQVGPEVEPGSTPSAATTAIDVRPGSDPVAAIHPLRTTPSVDPTPAIRALGVVPSEGPSSAVVPRPESSPSVEPADAPAPATSSVSIRPSDATVPATKRVVVTPSRTPQPALVERDGDDEDVAVEPAVDSRPAVRATGEATVARASAAEPRDTEPEPEANAEPTVAPSPSTTSALDRIAVVPGEEPDPAIERAPFVDRLDDPSDTDGPDRADADEAAESRGPLDRIKGWLGRGS